MPPPTRLASRLVPGEPCKARITRSGFDTAFSGNTTFSNELGLKTNFFEQSGRHTFGFLYSNKEFVSLAQDSRRHERQT